MHYRLRNLYIRTYWKSLILGLIYQKSFKNIRTYCMFVGYPRSGHSLIGALIDAHPNAIIGMQTDALGLFERGFIKKQILYLILKKSINFSVVHKNKWSGYSYHIPDSHQGRFTELLVIGDKQGAVSSRRIRNNPPLLSLFLSMIGYQIKMLHIVRNPFDVISTMYTRNLKEGKDFDRGLLEDRISAFFLNADINNILLNDPKLSIKTVFHESFIKDAKKEFSGILTYLNLEITNDFIEKCISIIYKEPHKSRLDILWPEDLKKFVGNKIKLYPFLKHYEFNS